MCVFVVSGFDDDELLMMSLDVYVIDVEDDGDMCVGDVSDLDDDGEDVDVFEDVVEIFVRG